jgi:hypothetical protein
MFVVRSGPKIPNVGSSCVVAACSQPGWAPLKTVRVIREEEHDASF